MNIDIDEFCDILNEVCEELPEDFFRELHQGIVVEEEAKHSPEEGEEDLLIMGEYNRSRYGNRIAIYYGSFDLAMPGAEREAVKSRLRDVVRHEFRHHLENLAGMYGSDSLEREDQIEMRRHREKKAGSKA